MKLKNVSENKAIISRFNVLMSKERLAHAYLFIGAESVGKYETALSIAKMINCERKLNDMYCDTCSSCIKIDHGSHPDVHIVANDKNEAIKIDQARQLLREAQLRPFESSKKIFIIKNIELLTAEASNALLKTLEEPSAQSLILLTTSFPERVLDTITSRCHVIKFSALTNDDLKEQLIKEYGLKDNVSHFLAYFSEGCLGRAIRLNEEKFFERKNKAIDQFVYVRYNETFLREFLADKDTENIQKILDVLLTWFRDLMLLQLNIEEIKLVNYDRAKDLKKIKNNYSLDDLKTITRDIVEVSRLLKENLNIKMALMLLKEKIWQN